MSRPPIPARMTHLAVDPRGYPVPWGAFVDRDGTPHFTINDEAHRLAMIRHDLCPICGKPLLRGRWFVGGPGSAFLPHGAYIDMPMHDECAHYVLQVCPYLAAPKFGREIGLRKAEQIKDGLVLLDPTTIADRPPLFVAVMAVGQRMTPGNGFQRYVIPQRPYRKVEFWRLGRELCAADARPDLERELARLGAA